VLFDRGTLAIALPVLSPTITVVTLAAGFISLANHFSSSGLCYEVGMIRGESGIME
jgi:hypothetical protein